MAKAPNAPKPTTHAELVKRMKVNIRNALDAIESRYSTPCVPADDLTGGELLRAQFYTRHIPIVNLVFKAMTRLNKSLYMKTLRFLSKCATFGDVNLLLERPHSFYIDVKEASRSETQSRPKSNSDIGKVEELDKIWATTKVNEYSMMAGRHTMTL